MPTVPFGEMITAHATKWKTRNLWQVYFVTSSNIRYLLFDSGFLMDDIGGRTEI